ncbi:hypothetical protein HG263_06685 [Pseudoalteromonas sp. JBTF-M23]|uniref:Holin (3TMs family) n=1 Tax=Pseudoalteromonas caenipelagi TaxID=2726988 RepID=A0A849VBK0_9GAMM|nr:hypothetical protein [Pseudoalteromonas caenipelagi]NOU50228.1 hypothetical protein [Pseudoalteromonas caenipelagi]
MDPITIALGIAKLTGLDDKIGRWIGGDNGAAVASKVVDMAQTLTGQTDPAQALDRISKNDELKTQFRLAVLNKEENLAEIAFKNVDSARKMQSNALDQDDKVAKRFVYQYAWFLTVSTFIYIGCITFIDIAPPATRYADTVLGFLLGTTLGAILQFFYGSSQGSKDKTNSLLNKFK